MASLGQQVIAGAQQQAQDVGHTVGDAMNAYHIAATAEHARQELEMEKQKQEMNKATWATSQLQAIARMPEATRKIATASFVKQAQQIYPDMSPDIAEAIQKDSDLTKGLAMTFAKQHGQDPTVVANAFGGDLPSLQAHISKTMEEETKIKAQQLGMASVRAQMLEETKRQHALSFSERATQDKIIGMSKQNLNSLNRSETILNGNLPVTAKDLALAYNDYINAVAAGGAATEGKIQRELPDTVIQDINELTQKYAGRNDDLRKTAAGKALIQQLGGRITGVKNDINGAIATQAQIYHDMGIHSGNPYVADAAKGILMQYAPDAYAQRYGGKQAAAPQAPPNPTPYGSTPQEIEANYKAFQAHKAHQQAGGD